MNKEHQTNLQEIIEEKVPKSKNNTKINYKKIGTYILVAIILLDTFQIMQFGSVINKVDKYNQGVVDELGKIRSNIIEFGNDLNETRQFLLLPTKNYSFNNDQDTEETKETTTKEAQAIYTFLLQETNKDEQQKIQQQLEKRIEKLINNKTFNENLETQGLKIQPQENKLAFKILEKDTPLFQVVGDVKNNQLNIQSAIGEEKISTEENSDAPNIISYITNNKDRVKKQKTTIEREKNKIKELKSNDEIKKLLQEKQITLDDTPTDTKTSYIYNLKNKEQQPISSITIIKKTATIKVGDKELTDIENLTNSVLDLIKTLDGRTEMEKLIAEKRKTLETIFKETAFQESLKQDGLTINLTPREEFNKLIYDVKDKEGKVRFSFAIELSSGMYKILKGDEELDLYKVLDETTKKKL